MGSIQRGDKIIDGKLYAWDDGYGAWLDHGARAEYSANQLVALERDLKLLKAELRVAPKELKAEIRFEIKAARDYISILKRVHVRLVALRDEAIEASKRLRPAAAASASKHSPD